MSVFFIFTFHGVFLFLVAPKPFIIKIFLKFETCLLIKIYVCSVKYAVPLEGSNKWECKLILQF